MSGTAAHCCESVTPLDIVVVDDDELTLDMVAWAFRDSQSSYRLFNDPVRAMNYLRESMPRILVVDFYMPGQNGLEFLSELNASANMNNSAVYLCSAILPRQEQLVRIEALGARILEKSAICNRTAMQELVRCCLDGKGDT